MDKAHSNISSWWPHSNGEEHTHYDLQHHKKVQQVNSVSNWNMWHSAISSGLYVSMSSSLDHIFLLRLFHTKNVKNKISISHVLVRFTNIFGTILFHHLSPSHKLFNLQCTCALLELQKACTSKPMKFTGVNFLQSELGWTKWWTQRIHCRNKNQTHNTSPCEIRIDSKGSIHINKATHISIY